MSLPVYPASDLRWNILQEGAVRNGSSAAYLLLLSAVDQGWSIRQPVRVFPNPVHPEIPSCHISLERKPGRQTRELAIPFSAELETYLTAEQIAVRIAR
ncbi:MAG TPA: hypothetical protein VN363_01635 [Anaerolineales bacterium]|nr:hypothetical protein [Anaerolineales bacterium]